MCVCIYSIYVSASMLFRRSKCTHLVARHLKMIPHCFSLCCSTFTSIGPKQHSGFDPPTTACQASVLTSVYFFCGHKGSIENSTSWRTPVLGKDDTVDGTSPEWADRKHLDDWGGCGIRRSLPPSLIRPLELSISAAKVRRQSFERRRALHLVRSLAGLLAEPT